MKVIAKVSKWIGLRVIAVFAVYLLVCFVLYRIPASSDVEFIEGKVLYQLTEAESSNRRMFEELLMQNSILRLEGNKMWYVSSSDRAKLWPEDPISMYKKGYTIAVKLKTQKLLFGGYADAEVVSYHKLAEKPTVWK